MTARKNWQPDVNSGGDDDESKGAGQAPASASRPMPHPDVYTGWLGRAVNKLKPTTEADPVAVLASLASGFSVMIGSEPHVQIHDDQHPLVIWPMVIGYTSLGRKGMSWTVSKKVIKRADGDFYAGCVTSGLSSGEGLIQCVADEEEAEHPSGKKLLIVETEYGVTMARAGRDGNTLGGVLRQAWEGDNLRVLTRASLRATSPHIGIIAHITPGEFRARVKSAEMAGGTYNRYLPIYSERLHEIPLGEGAGDEVLTTIAVEFEQRAKRAQDVRAVKLSPEARDFWMDVVYSALSTSSRNEGALGQFTARATPYCRRLAAIYALVDECAVVKVEHLRAAYALMAYSRASAAYILGAESTGDPDVDKALDALTNAGPDGLSRSQFYADVFQKHMKAGRLDDVLAKLGEIPGIEHARRPTGGRPVDVWVCAAQEAQEAEKASRPAETHTATLAQEARIKAPSGVTAPSCAPNAQSSAAGQTTYSASYASYAGTGDDAPLPPEPDDPEDYGPGQEYEV